MSFLLLHPWRVGILMLLLAFLLYGKSLNNGYALDDHLVLTPTTELGFKGIIKSFKSSYLQNNQNGEKSGYRPLTLATFALEVALVGKHASVSHAVSIVLYGLTAALLYVVLCALLTQVRHHDQFLLPSAAPLPHLWALLATLLFVIHPLHTEVVLNIKSRDELLALFFALSAAWCLLRPRLGLWSGLGIVLCSTAALLCKITILPTLAVWLFGIALLRGFRPKRWLLLVGVVLAAVATYKILGRTLTDKNPGNYWQYIENPLYAMSLIERLPMGWAVMGYYLKLLFIPAPLVYYYGYNYVPLYTWASPIAWVSLLLHLGLAYWAIRQYRQRPLLALGVAYYLIHALAFSNIFKVGPGIVAERFFYGGSVGFCWVLAYGLLWWATATKTTQQPANAVNLPLQSDKKRQTKTNKDSVKNSNKTNTATLTLRPMFWIATAVLLLAGGVMIQVRIPAWRNLLTLCQTDMPNLDRSAKANLLYADILTKDLDKATLEQWQLAEKHYRRAIEIYPNYYAPYNNLGFFYLKTNRFAEANEVLLQAQTHAPQSAQVLYNLGSASLKLGINDKAKGYFEQATRYEPESEAGLGSFGALHNIYGTGNDTTAMTYNLIRAMMHHPHKSFFFQELIRYYTEQQKIPYLHTRIRAAADTLDEKHRKELRRILPD